MNYKIKASIIIPTFNRKDMLLETLVFLNKQIGDIARKFEVIIVDDGSTDGTKSFVADFGQNNKLIYSLSYYNTNLTDVFGTSVARNMGIKNAQGQWLLFLDDDCLAHPQWLNSHLKALEQGEKIVIGYRSNIKRKLAEVLPLKIEEASVQREYEASVQGKLVELASANFSIARECIDLCGMFDERFARKEGYGYEDIEFGHRLIMGNFKLSFCADALVYMPPNSSENQALKDKQAQKSKRLWWHIIQHPQKDLPITPQLLAYAERKKQELTSSKVK